MKNQKSTFVLGLMSGTSLDGIDLVYVKFDVKNNYEIINRVTYSYNSHWSKILSQVFLIPKGDKKLIDLDVLLGQYFADKILNFISEFKIQHVDIISSHGHTVHHQPDLGYTLQIGCGKEIFKKTRITTVYDFRTQDVLYGGQGAPLVPIGDQLLFSSYNWCLNLGGFSNVSYELGGVRKAYDICPVNTVLNFYANQLGVEYDDGGELAKQGVLNDGLLLALNNLSFYNSTNPKSLGVEFLKEVIFPLIDKYEISKIDVLRTFVEHIACQITKKIKNGNVLLTGGGVFNVFLIDRIRNIGNNLSLVIPSDEIINYKEALVFSLLGKLRLENEVNCLASVTGAFKDHSSGKIVF